MIARISEAIQSAGGCILDFRFFSNLALFIDAEISSTRMDALRSALVRTELQLDSRSLAKVAEFYAATSSDAGTGQVCPVHLLVTFIHSDPDLRITVPAIPG